MMQLPRKLAQKAKLLATLTCGLMLSFNPAFGSSNTAVTAKLVKSKAQDNLLICQYQTVSASHFQVFDKLLDNEHTCPSNLLVAPEPMVSQAEAAQLKQLFSQQYESHLPH
ncbi:hypothetical protein [Shewanella fidelis]|uniref:hypothetical protein n=1 Tax=Shewanella fidelis TaxID=173509 RepID=UPI00048BB616|nr:hypothetical protein [Shewanella fidelis]